MIFYPRIKPRAFGVGGQQRYCWWGAAVPEIVKINETRTVLVLWQIKSFWNAAQNLKKKVFNAKS